MNVHKLTQDDLDRIEDAFGIPRNGPWNRFAVSYVGLSFPLSAGWKVRLLRDGAPDNAPVATGVDPNHWRWVLGGSDDDEDLKEVSVKVDPKQYVLLRVDALEMVLNDLRTQAEGMKKEIRELRDMLSEDGW